MIVLLAAALAVACVALADALRNAAAQRHRAETAEAVADALAGEVNHLRARRVAAPRVFERAPGCEFCALASVGTTVALHTRTPIIGLRGPRREDDPPHAFLVRWGDA